MDFIKRLIPGAVTALEFHIMRLRTHWLTAIGTFISFLVFCYLAVSAPFFFTPQTIVIKQGASAGTIARELEAARVVSFATPLWLALKVSGASGGIRAGTYRFTVPENAFSVARRLATADYGLPMVKITFPEGSTVREMAEIIHKALPGISEKDFIAAAKPSEGYLFPDTYSFPPSTDVDSIIATLRTNFNTKTRTLSGSLAASKRSLADIIVMASLIEKEARTDESRRMVSGILWNRLDRDMPLQVDAVFGYIFNRDTYSPSLADLKVDSPYNTYRNKGLPPGPISNPGLSALLAAANPDKTPYLYYLTGNDNRMHYATTNAGHEANRQKYLR